MQSKQNSCQKATAEEASNRKIKATSNMAFEDVLKSRGAVLPLGQSRAFNYNTKPPLPEGQHPNVSTQHESVQVDQTSQEIQLLMEKNQNLQARYSQAKQLCADQLTALEESKILMQKQAIRSSELEKTLEQLKNLVDQQKRVIDQQKVIINQNNTQMESYKRNTQLLRDSDDEKIKLIEGLREQIRVLTLKCQIRERNIESLKQELQELRSYIEETEVKVRFSDNLREQLERVTKEFIAQSELRQKLEEEGRQMKIVATQFSNDIRVLRQTIDQYQIQLEKISNEDNQEQIKQLTDENSALKESIQQMKRFLEDIRVAHRDYVRSLNQKHQQEVRSIRVKLEEQINSKTRLSHLEQVYLTGLDELQKSFKVEVQAVKIKCEQEKQVLMKELQTRKLQIEGAKLEVENLQRISLEKIQIEKKIHQIGQSSQKKCDNLQDQIENLKQEKDVLEKQLEVMKSVAERQKKILCIRDEASKQLQVELEKAQIQLKQQKTRISQLEGIVLSSRQTIIHNLEAAKNTSTRQKELFSSIVEENRQLKAKMECLLSPG